MTKNPRYTIEKVDAFKWLKDRKASSIHAIVTDPPFGVIEYTETEIEKRTNGNGGIWRLPQSYDLYKRAPVPRFTILTPMQIARVRYFHGRLAPLLHRALVPGGHVIMASQNLLSHFVVTAFTRAGFEMRGQIARVVKTLRGGDRPKFGHEQFPDVSVTPRSCWEPWLIFRKPCEGLVKDNLEKWGTGGLRRPLRDRPFMDLITASPARGRERKIAPHPSLKPQSFMRGVVSAVLPMRRGVILDPFMGSGSTIAAAEAVRLRAIGLELSDEYFRMAKAAIPQLAALGAIPTARRASKSQPRAWKPRRKGEGEGRRKGKGATRSAPRV